MPSINKIRLVNIRFNSKSDGRVYSDETFCLSGKSSLIHMPNGGGKSSLIQFVLQTVYPGIMLNKQTIGERLRSEGTSHIAVEWFYDDANDAHNVPCFLTSISFFRAGDHDTLRHVQFTMPCSERHNIETLPLVVEHDGATYPTKFDAMCNIYKTLANQAPGARFFPESSTREEYRRHLQKDYHLVQEEVKDICKINRGEGNDGMDAVFGSCTTEVKLVKDLLLPMVEGNFSAGVGIFKEHQADVEKLRACHLKMESCNRFEDILRPMERNEETFYCSEEEIQNVRGQLLAGFHQSSDHVRELTGKWKELRAENDALTSERDALVKEAACIEVHLAEKAMQEAERNSDQSMVNLNREQKNLLEVRTFLYNRTFKNQVREVKNLQDDLQRIQQQIEDAAKEFSTEDLRGKLTETSGKLHFLFDEDLAALDSQCKSLQSQHDEHQRLADDAEERYKTIDKESRRLENAVGRLQSEAAYEEKSLKSHLELCHLAGKSREELPSQLDSWMSKYDDAIEKDKKYIRNLEGKRSNAAEQKAEWEGKERGVREDLVKKRANRESLLRNIAEADSDAKEVYPKLELPCFPDGQFSSTESLYDVSVRQRINHAYQVLVDNDEKLLADIRTLEQEIGRFDAADHFEVEPFLTKNNLPLSLRNLGMFSVTSFLLGREKSREDIRKIISAYPQLASAVVLPKDNIERARRVMEEHADCLQHFVYFLSPQELDVVLSGQAELFDYPVVLPKDWDLIHPDAFAEWKHDKEIEIDRLSSKRKPNLRLIRKYEEAREALSDFLGAHPSERYLKTKSDAEALAQDIQDNEVVLVRIQKEIKSNEKILNDAEAKIHQLEVETRNFQEQKDAAVKARSSIFELQKKEARLSEITAKKQELLVQGEQIQRERDKEKEAANSFANARRIAEAEIEKIQKDKLFLDTKEAVSVRTEESKASLAETRRSLLQDIREIEDRQKKSNRLPDLREEQNRKLADLKVLNNELDSLKKEANRVHVVLDEAYDGSHFPHPNASDESLRCDIGNSEKEISKLEAKQKAAHDALTEAKKLFDIRSGDYLKDFAEDYTVLPMAENVVERQADVARRQGDVKKLIDESIAQQKINTTNLNKMKDLVAKFNDLNAVADFKNREGVPIVPAPEGFLSDVRSAEAAFDELKKCFLSLKAKEKQIWDAREQYQQKLRKSTTTDEELYSYYDKTIQCLKSIHTLEDFQTFARGIHKTIADQRAAAERIAITLNETKEHVCKFFAKEVTRIQTELRKIEHNTQLEVQGEKVSIFRFDFIDLPEEYSMEELIERYLESIASKKDGDIDLKKALSPMNILTAAYNNEPNFLHIYCHKPVDSDELLEKKATPWAETSHFSGGELWFRNTSLFLAILNYAASKNNVKLRRRAWYTRFVIMDNPFANASTMNVMRPVFILADQMRFQMICMTAIKDQSIFSFFPVLYSVDPMTTTDPNTSAMAVREINMRFASVHQD